MDRGGLVRGHFLHTVWSTLQKEVHSVLYPITWVFGLKEDHKEDHKDIIALNNACFIGRLSLRAMRFLDEQYSFLNLPKNAVWCT